MSNLSNEVDNIRDYVRRGMPEGGEPVLKSLNILFNRIEELERALAPFAKRGLVDNKNMPLIEVYHNDCKNAYKALSKAYAAALKPKEPEYLPAEV